MAVRATIRQRFRPPVCRNYAIIPGSFGIWCEAYGSTQTDNDQAVGEVYAYNCTDGGWASVDASYSGSSQYGTQVLEANTYYNDQSSGLPAYSDTTRCIPDGGCEFNDNSSPDPQPCGGGTL